MKKNINICENIIGAVCLLYYAAMRIFYGRIVSLEVWLVLSLLLLVKSTLCIILSDKMCGNAKKAVNILQTIYDSVFALFLATFAVYLIFAAVGMTEKHDEEAISDCDACLILGAAVYGEEPSPILSERIERAYDLLTQSTNAVAVCTGGIGSRAVISEAECIKRELIKKGISPKRLITEDVSSTTVENMRFALSKLPEEGMDCIAVVTSGFHVSRAKLILSNFTSAKVIGIPAPGGGMLLPHYLLREYVVFVIDVACRRYSPFI